MSEQDRQGRDLVQGDEVHVSPLRPLAWLLGGLILTVVLALAIRGF